MTSIDVLMSSAEGALVRLLGLVGRRGYGIASVQARMSECGGSTYVQLQVSGERPAALLIAQIQKLYDVRSVRAAEMVTVAGVVGLDGAPSAHVHPRAQAQVA